MLTRAPGGGRITALRRGGRNARALAGLFEFEEFERRFRTPFRHAPTLRVAADLIAQRAVRRAGSSRAKGEEKKGRGEEGK